LRIGAIATFVCDADRYLLAQFFQENLKYVKPGQDVETAIDLYPGQIFTGKVLAIWQGSGAGQMLPSGVLPNFQAVPTDRPQGQFAVAIKLDDPDPGEVPDRHPGPGSDLCQSGKLVCPLAQDHAARLLVVQLDLSILRLMRIPDPGRCTRCGIAHRLRPGPRALA
jgi:hypothetical protein